MAQRIKTLPAMKETKVWSLSLEDALEKGVATHSSTLAWKIPWAEEPGSLQSMGSLRVRHDWATSLSFSPSCIGEGNGNPLQCSCLENPRGEGAWWAAVYGVAQSWTRLKRLSSSSRASVRIWVYVEDSISTWTHTGFSDELIFTIWLFGTIWTFYKML